ncbi:hypothetical protein JTE90_002827 [Oedothorax gibbosus]|uniref:Uncharacterized protein n=1 Tax=Oedothorax gibbosus TaxID=931172 RepID=A0AAV6U7J2_9ARAC|nr:hypothetical protein JTE90_002827 [Oedothorax gibbosus]
MFTVSIFIGLYVSIEAKPTDADGPLQVSKKKLEISEELFHPNNDYFDLFFNGQKPNPQDRKYEQELDIGNRSENITYEDVLSHDNESTGYLKNVSDNNQGNVFGLLVNTRNKASQLNNDTNSKRRNEHKSSLIPNESDKRGRKEKKHFKYSNLRKIRLGVKIKNDNNENLNEYYGNSDDNNKNYLSGDRGPSRNNQKKGSNNLRQISNNFKFKKFRNHEQFIDKVKDSISEESDESLIGNSFRKLWNCSENETEENKSDCKTYSEKNRSEFEAESDEKVSESETDPEESKEPNSSGQVEGKYSSSKVSHQQNDKSGHLKHRAKHFKIKRNDNLNALYPDKTFERENTSIEDDQYLIKHGNRGESNEVDQLNKNEMPLLVENLKQTNSKRYNYKYEKNKVLDSNEKHFENDINESNGFVTDNQKEKVNSRKRFGRQNNLNIQNLNRKAIGYPEDEYLREKNSELINRNKRIKSKFSTPSAEQFSPYLRKS